MAAKGKAPKKEKKEKKGKLDTHHSKKKKGVKGIIRIAGTDMFGETTLKRAVMKVQGIGHSIGNALAGVIAEKLSVPMNIEVGDLNEKQLEELDSMVSNVGEYLPKYLLNRRKDPEDGKDKHVITNDLIFTTRQDVEKEKKIYSWKGYRHAYGKKVRGQKTRNTGRHGRAVGVVRKALQDAQKAAKKEEKKK